jgi:hypothetical protein
MKRIALLIALLVGTLTTAHAQFEKGKWVVNPAITGFGFSYNTDADRAHFGIDASGGAFLIDNVALLARLGAAVNGANGDGFTLGVGGRYYFDKVGVYLGANANYFNYHSDGFTLGLEAGYAFFLTRTVTIEPAVYCNFIDQNDFGLKIGFGFYF